jgi:hypothetical protein
MTRPRRIAVRVTLHGPELAPYDTLLEADDVFNAAARVGDAPDAMRAASELALRRTEGCEP